MSSLKMIVSGFLNLLYPSKCPVCESNTDNIGHAPFCLSCWATIQRYNGPSCSICAKPLVSAHSTECGFCRSKRPLYSSAVFFGLYNGILREAIHQYKFYGNKRLGRELGSLMSDIETPDADLIVPVPLDKSSLKDRGFNQTLLLAMEISRSKRIPVGMGVLNKKRKTMPQVGLPLDERLINLKDAFEADEDLGGRRVLLIDDVMTTGATVSECTKELIKAGAEKVLYCPHKEWTRRRCRG